jgi:hypothetical protein
MRIEFTDDEVATILVALDNYRELMNDRFHWSADEADQQEAGSAEWCWQKLHGMQQQQFNNSVADAVGEGEQPNNTTNASVDPFTLPTRSNYENMK